ncbi:MAG: response regulator [Lachnospiraceae bacterium]|nr:response regulator [Lachnospiraceae bacterium]
MIKVLVAEDEMPLLRGIRIMIERISPEFSVVKCALNGREAVDYLKENPVDVIFTDINMPLLDGIELMKITHENYSEIIVVAISGYNDFHYAQQAIEYQVKRYLLKPIVMEDMEALLEEIQREYNERNERKERERIVDALCTGLGGNLKEDILKESTALKRESTEELMQRVEVYIREHLTEPITVKELASEFGLVAPYLGKLFKDYTGYTPGQYIQMLRIEHAKCLLSVNGELLAKDVAELVGYTDPAYFSKLFKKKVGVWPSEFKAKKGE